MALKDGRAGCHGLLLCALSDNVALLRLAKTLGPTPPVPRPPSLFPTRVLTSPLIISSHLTFFVGWSLDIFTLILFPK
jgi:hypothetical protein